MVLVVKCIVDGGTYAEEAPGGSGLFDRWNDVPMQPLGDRVEVSRVRSAWLPEPELCCCLLARVFVRLVVTNNAACSGTDSAVVSGEMPSNSTDNCALQAASRLCW